MPLKKVIPEKPVFAQKNELHLKFSDQLIEALIGGEIFFSPNGSCQVSKCPSFCVDFKNVNLP
jgi:hypothetical protein